MQIETRSIDYVPAAERHGHAWHLWPVWFTSGMQLASVATGVIGIALGANFLWTAVAAAAGCALGTLFMALHSAQGPQLGLPQMIQSRPQFGYMGALLVWVIALISYVGYNAFNEVLGGDTANQLWGLNAHFCGTLFTVLALGISAVGYDLIHRAQRWLAYLLISVLALFSLGAGLRLQLPAHAWSLRPFPAIAFLTQFFAAAAYQLSGAFYVSDYSRYLPRSVGVVSPFYWTYGGAFAGSLWAMLVGTAAASLFPHQSVAAALRAAGDAVWPGFGGVLLAVALLGLLTMTSLNYYGGSLTLLSVADSFRPLRPTRSKRVLSVLAVGVAAHTIAYAVSGDFVRGFSDLLSILLCLFTPWTAINLVDFYLVRRARYSIREIFNPHGLYGRWNWRGLTAYAAGFAAMLPFVNTELFEGPVARALDGADVSMPVGLAVAALIYYGSYRGIDLEPEFQRIEVADRHLDAEAPHDERCGLHHLRSHGIG
jgi:nucleobase:cation symporter-1, NCS1 family